jgi:hypothetical protein
MRCVGSASIRAAAALAPREGEGTLWAESEPASKGAKRHVRLELLIFNQGRFRIRCRGRAEINLAISVFEPL